MLSQSFVPLLALGEVEVGHLLPEPLQEGGVEVLVVVLDDRLLVFREFRHGRVSGRVEGCPGAGYSIGRNVPGSIERIPMPTITFTNEKKEIQVPDGANLRKEALRAGVAALPGHPQGGQLPRLRQLRLLPGAGHQGDGKLQPARACSSRPGWRVSLAYIGNEGTMRLACQTKVKGDITVTTCPPLNLFGENFFS